MSDKPRLRVGIDIGSKTVKVVVLGGEGQTLFAFYDRHLSNVKQTLLYALRRTLPHCGDAELSVGVTGSAGIQFAELMGLPFVQEVLATKIAIEHLLPETDVAIELGGEDSKILFMAAPGSSGGEELRMNNTCAGGTGGFIDTIAGMFDLNAEEFNHLALGCTTVYPIASRCAVFAQSDVRPLLNEGVSKCDIAGSVFAAVATQCISGLAAGRAIKGRVALLGGPFSFLSALRYAFTKALGSSAASVEAPIEAHLFVAKGAAIFAAEQGADGCASQCGKDGLTIAALQSRLELVDWRPDDYAEPLAPLFASELDYAHFKERHNAAAPSYGHLNGYEGQAYLGIDSGSTTIKCVLAGEGGEFLFTYYERVAGDLVEACELMLTKLYRKLPRLHDGSPAVRIAHTCVTGYGEELLRKAFLADSGEVETVAHLRAAQQAVPDVSALLDIGGQDIKYLTVRNGALSDVVLNEACSSGCGALVGGFAYSMNVKLQEFTEAALFAKRPVDLGTRCTVFMTSRVRHAQKEGATTGDISAGLAYSVVRNALFKVMRLHDTAAMGNKLVVQGGAFRSDAVLRAFELLCGREVYRSSACEYMGAYGAALLAKDRSQQATPSTVPSGRAASPKPPLEQGKASTGPSGRAASLKAPLNHAQAAVSAKPPYRVLLQVDGRAASPRPPLEQGKASTGPSGRAASPKPPLEQDTAAASAPAHGPSGRAASPRPPLEQGTAAASAPAATPAPVSLKPPQLPATTLLDLDGIANLRAERSHTRCGLCPNRCALTVSTFTDARGSAADNNTRRLIVGNRCTRPLSNPEGAAADAPAAAAAAANAPINLYSYTYNKLINYHSTPAPAPSRGRIGMILALDTFANYPLWHTLLSQLGYHVELSDPSSRSTYLAGAESIISESACYPAKIAFGHLMNLADKGLEKVFSPCVTRSGQGRLSCPVLSQMPLTLALNAAPVRDGKMRLLTPRLDLSNAESVVDGLYEAFSEAGEAVDKDELRTAWAAGCSALGAFRADIRREGAAAVEALRERGRRGVVLAGRPYHLDPELHHGLPELLTSYGLAVLTSESVAGLAAANGGLGEAALPGALGMSFGRALSPKAPPEHGNAAALGDAALPGELAAGSVPASSIPELYVDDRWEYPSTVYNAAAYVAQSDCLDFIELYSFGCGIDALACDQARDILERRGRLFTSLKIDEMSDMAATRIRMRSMLAALSGAGAGSVLPALSGSEADGGSLSENPSTRHCGLGPQSPPLPAEPETHMPCSPSAEPETYFFVNWAPGYAQGMLSALAGAGFPAEDFANIHILPQCGEATVRKGLACTNNDCCYSAIFAVGQAMQAAAGADAGGRRTIVVPYTCVDCRAGDIPALIRKAMADAGFSGVNVVSMHDLLGNPETARRLAPYADVLAQSLVLHDLKAQLAARLRPYVSDEALHALLSRHCGCKTHTEAKPSSATRHPEIAAHPTCHPEIAAHPTCHPEIAEGKAQDLADRGIVAISNCTASAALSPATASIAAEDPDPDPELCLRQTQDFRQTQDLRQTQDDGSGVPPSSTSADMPFEEQVRSLLAEAVAMLPAGLPRKRLVAMVGTAPVILNSTMNNSTVRQLEDEGCEVVLPWYSDHVLYALDAAGCAQWLSAAVEQARATVAAALSWKTISSQANTTSSNGGFGTLGIMTPRPLAELRKMATGTGLVSARETSGIGWLYVAHVQSCLEAGIRNIVYAHSFGCLPAHTIGRGILRELRECFSGLNIVSIEHDPGASAVNQSNRLKLLASLAK